MGASAALGLQAAGVATTAMGAYKTANANKAALNYEAAVAQNNAQIANYQANLAEADGAVQENNIELKEAATLGDQRAALAANGVDLGSGSPNEILTTTKFMGNRDVLTMRDNYARQAWAYRNQASGYAGEAGFDTATANAINPAISAGTSLLSGAGSVAGTWYKYKTAGLNR